jgi:hypothetical protein
MGPGGILIVLFDVWLNPDEGPKYGIKIIPGASGFVGGNCMGLDVIGMG